MMILGLFSPPLLHSSPPNANAVLGPFFPHLRLASSLHSSLSFRLYASTAPRPRQRRRGSKGGAELSSTFDDDDDDDDDDVDEDSDEDDENVDGESDLGLALGEMNRWFADKPKGFGEGKVYDTGVEEKLLKEIEQTRAAQRANLANLRSPAPSTAPRKPKNDARPIIDVPSGIPVRISNLPRKRNIHRDLKLAFEGFSGIASINPAVTASKKTRDPICKGFAFVYLHSAEAAHRFVEVFSNKNIRFGKVEKRIICEAKKRRALDDVECKDEDLSDIKEGFEDFEIEGIDGSLPRENDRLVLVTTNPSDAMLLNCELTEDENESIAIIGSEEEETLEIMNGATALSVRNSPKLQKVTNQQKPKKTRQKSSKLFVPKSAIRLKIKEKAVLTGVLSKYSGKTEEAAPLNAKQT